MKKRFDTQSKAFKPLPAMLLAVAITMWGPDAHAANIIGFADNATSCGGSTICSSNGTQGYFNNGTGVAFDLSSLTQWFQIDPDGVNRIPGQPGPEPDGGAGNFLVVNDTGTVVTSFSLTLTNTFTSSTPSVGPCTGLQAGNPTGCDQFQIHGGAANYFSILTLTGASCDTGCGTASANFGPNSVTYNWSKGSGTGIPIGATFDLNFASWNNALSTPTTSAPEPSSLLLLGTGLLLGAYRLKRRLS